MDEQNSPFAPLFGHRRSRAEVGEDRLDRPMAPSTQWVGSLAGAFGLVAAMAACALEEGDIADGDEGSAVVVRDPTAYAPHTPQVLSGQPHFVLSEAGGNGSALSWDGRLYFAQTRMPRLPTATYAARTPVMSLRPGQFTLERNQTRNAGPVSLRFEAADNGAGVIFSLVDANNPSRRLWRLWETCAEPCRAVFEPDGQLSLVRTVPGVDGVPKSQGGVPLRAFASGTRGVALHVYASDPYVMLETRAGQFVELPGFGGWGVKVFRPEHLTASQPSTPAAVRDALNASFSPVYPAFIANDAIRSRFPDAVYLDMPFVNALGLVPDPQFLENPYRSNASGVADARGTHATYRMKVFTQEYPNGQRTNVSEPLLGVLRCTVIVRSPWTAQAEVEAVSMTQPFERLRTASGESIPGIEPTLTFDGRLLVYQSNGGILRFVHNSAADAGASGWSTPAPINQLHARSDLHARYPLARSPIRDARGRSVVDPLPGAYPWLSLDGTDLFFAAAPRSSDNIMRSGQAVVGASTKGLWRQVDGGPNHSRYGWPDRLFISSPGRMPGMWSPLEFMPRKVLPLTDKVGTYPIFSSNGGLYFEASFEETIVGNYDLYLEMAEAMQRYGYDLSVVPDVSGFFHPATKNAGAMFAEEAFPGQCTPGHCPLNDPWDASSRLFSGKAMSFLRSGQLSAVAQSLLGNHTILADARDLTVSLAVRPLVSHAQLVPASRTALDLVRKDGAFQLEMGRDGRITGRLFAVQNGVQRTFSIGPVGSALPVGDWTHVAMTFDGQTGAMRLHLNGAAVGQVNVDVSSGVALRVASTDARPVIVGPGLSGDASSEVVLALDQVAVSRVVRSSAEIYRQANRVLPRRLLSGRTLPPGLMAKDIADERMLASSSDAAKVELGRHLFFDPRLSENGQVSCETCHLSSRDFTENLVLHPTLTSSGNRRHLLRNTPSLLNMPFKRSFFYDGRAFSLEAQAHAVLTNPEEMGRSVDVGVGRLRESPQYRTLFSRAFPGQSEPITGTNLVEGLAEFQRSLLAGNSKFDRYMGGELGALNAEERQGMALFFGKAKCAECHAGSAFTDNQFHALPFVPTTNVDGVVDEGRARVTGSAQDRFKVLTPSLRNLVSTGPYFRNGSAATLEEVVALYHASGDRAANGVPLDDALMTIDLSADGSDARRLVAFLRALQGESPRVDRPTLEPSTPAPTVTYSWSTGAWGTCSQSCGGGTQTRTVTCRSSESGNPTVADSFCSASIRPASSLACNTQACPLPTTRTFLPGRTLSEGGLLLQHGQNVETLNYRLWMQGDGNLVLYRKSDNAAVWHTRTGGRSCTSSSPCRANFQGDGNLVVYQGSSVLWHSNSYGQGATALELQGSVPYLSIVAGTRRIWSSQ